MSLKIDRIERGRKMSTFNELNLSPEILKSLAGLGYEKMTDVQSRVLERLLVSKLTGRKIDHRH